MLTSMKRLARVRWLSTEAASKAPNLAVLDEKVVKPFTEIAKEMAQKTSSYHRNLYRKNSKTSISKIRVEYQSMKDQFSLGDAIMIDSSVYAVVKMPTSFQDPIIVCDAKGVTKKVWPAMVTARLANLVPSKSEILSNCLNKDQTAVSGSVYEHFGYPLGSLQNDALAIARELVPKVVDIILLLQRDVPVTVSLYDFFSLVLKLKDTDLTSVPTLDWPQPIDERIPEFTSEFILAMRMVFDDYLVRNKVRLEFGYTKKNIVVVKSLKTEKGHVDMVNKNTTMTRHDYKIPQLFVDYVKDYALDNVSTTDPQSAGIAIQILRATEPYKNLPITKHHAFEWVHKYQYLNTEGPYLDRDAYQWFSGAAPEKDARLESLGKIAAAAAGDKLQGMRVDVEEPVWCIDSDDTTEVDDGISITSTGNNIATVQVHIANPTCAFQDPQPLIDAVYARTTTVYMPQRKIAMLPQEFAQVYSLSKGSPALTVSMDIDTKTGERLSTKIQASTMKNVKRVNYKQVEEILSGKHGDDTLSPIHDLYNLSTLFYKSRLAKNAVTNLLVQNSPKVSVGPDGQVQLDTEKTPRATQLVTELMLQANSAVAQHTQDNNIPCIYRFNSLSFYTEAQRQEFFNQEVIGFEWMPAMRSSVESTTPQPHSLTGLDKYTWFTSPLRRAQDILLHMQLEAYLLKNEFPLSVAKLNNMIPWISASQSLTKLFQRQNDRYYILKYLEGRQDAVVTGYLQQVDHDSGIQTIYIPEFGVSAELARETPIGPGPHSFSIQRVSAITNLLRVRKFAAKL